MVSVMDQGHKIADPADRPSGRFGSGFARHDVWGVLIAVLAAGGLTVLGFILLGAGAHVFAGMALGSGFVLGAGSALFAGIVLPLQARRMRRAYRESLFQTVEASPNMCALSDAHGRLKYANPAYRAWAAQVSPGAEDLDALLADADSKARVRDLKECASQGRPACSEITLMDRAGGHNGFRVSAHPFIGAPGEIVWSLVDVTHLHTRLEESRRTVANLADFLDDIPRGVISLDTAGRFVFANKTFADWTGCNAADLMAAARRLDEFIGDDGTTRATLARVVSMVEMRDGATLVLRGVDGTERFVEVIQSVSSDSDGGACCTRTILRDISEERATRQELEDAKAHFVNFFDKAPLGIVLVAADGTVKECNPAAMTLMGDAAREGACLLNGIAEEDRNDVVRVLTAEEVPGRRQMLECKLAGTPERFMQLYISRVDSAESQSIIYIYETTEQKNLELQFAQSQKMQAVGQLAGGIAHDFNNLLTAILGFSDLLLTRHAAGDPSFTDIMQIKQNANRAASLVRQLLAFSRQQRLNPKVLEVTDVLAEVSHLIRRLIGENIDLRISHDRNLGPVKVDQGQLEQVIINLAVNARDAMPDGGVLTIRTRGIDREESRALGHTLMPAADYVLIEVMDTGTGIPKEVIGKIFEPFFTTKEVGRGTGLGLSTVYGIIKQTGGFIFPDNLADGGAVFRIYLPVHQEEAGAEKRTETARYSVKDLTGKGTILLVEDEEAVRLFAARALENKGYEVLQAQSGEEALEIVRSHDGDIHLMVSDVVMPQMDGPTLVKNAREHRQGMKIIFISGYAENAFSGDLDKRDFTFLPKPFSLKKLAETVKDVFNEEYAE